MTEQWYYHRDQKKCGPVSRDELRQMLAAGQLIPSDMVLQQGTPKWVPASSIAGVQAEGGRSFPGWKPILAASGGVVVIALVVVLIRGIATNEQGAGTKEPVAQGKETLPTDPLPNMPDPEDDGDDKKPRLPEDGTPRMVAQVVAEGVGMTEDNALKDAFRNAVRQVVGAVVDAETLVKNDELISDKVLTYSDGIVKTYEEISKKQDQGLIRIKIMATVERRSLIARLKAANVAVKDVDGKGLFAEIITQLEAEKNAEALLDKALEGFPLNVMTAEIEGTFKVVENSASGATIEVVVRIQTDPKAYSAFASKLEKTLTSITKVPPGEMSITEEGKTHFQTRKLTNELEKLAGKKHHPKAKPGIHIDDKTAIAINVYTTHTFERTDWRCYVMGASCRNPLKKVSQSKRNLRLTLIDGNGKPIAKDTSELTRKHSNLPLSPILPLEARGHSSNDYQQRFYALSPLYFQHGNHYWVDYSPNIIVTRRLRLSLGELKSTTRIVCELADSK